MPRALPIVLVVLALFAPAIAHADEPEPNGPSPIYDDFTKKARETEESLATGDCTAACKALASLRQAMEELCQISPGPRCERARASEAEMTKRVRAACPTCAIAFAPNDDKKAPVMEPAKPGAAETATVDRAPPAAERGRGGCASCDVTGGGGASFDPSWIALVFWALARRRKKFERQA